MSPLRYESCCGGQRLDSKDVVSPVRGDGKERSVAHSEALGDTRERGTDRLRTLGFGPGGYKGGATEDLTWDSIVVPRLAKYYGTAVK